MRNKKISEADRIIIEQLVNEYGTEILLNEFKIDKRKLAALAGAGLIAGSSLIGAKKDNTETNNITCKNHIVYNAGINRYDLENIMNKTEAVKKYIDNVLRRNGKSINDIQFDPENLVIACYKYDYDLPLLLAQLQVESHFGTTDRAKRTNSMFSVRAYDDGRDIFKFGNMDASIIQYIKLMKNDYLDGGRKEISDLLKNFVNYRGHRYASNPNYERDLTLTRNKILKLYPELMNDYICLD